MEGNSSYQRKNGSKTTLVDNLYCTLDFFCQCDPDTLQDFCIAELKNQPFINGFPCKSPKDVTSDDFFFAGLAQEKFNSKNTKSQNK